MDGFHILFLTYTSLARSVTLLDMIIKAGSLLADVLWKIAVAGSYPVQLVNKLQCILYCKPTRIRPEILGLVLLHVTGHHNTRKSLIYCHLDIRITLIILKHCIVSWTMLLYKVTLQYKCLELRVRNYIFKTVYPRHHLFNL